MPLSSTVLSRRSNRKGIPEISRKRSREYTQSTPRWNQAKKDPDSPCPWGFSTHVGVGGLLRHEDAADLTELLVHLQESEMRGTQVLGLSRQTQAAVLTWRSRKGTRQACSERKEDM